MLADIELTAAASAPDLLAHQLDLLLDCLDVGLLLPRQLLGMIHGVALTPRLRMVVL